MSALEQLPLVVSESVPPSEPVLPGDLERIAIALERIAACLEAQPQPSFIRPAKGGKRPPGHDARCTCEICFGL